MIVVNFSVAFLGRGILTGVAEYFLKIFLADLSFGFKKSFLSNFDLLTPYLLSKSESAEFSKSL